jgi:hypothetical protein
MERSSKEENRRCYRSTAGNRSHCSGFCGINASHRKACTARFGDSVDKDKPLFAMSQYCLPVNFDYNGRKYSAAMGPFQHSAEREFALTVNRRAIDDCSSLTQLKPIAKNLLEGWSAMQTAFQSLMLENIQLRQALDKRDADLQAAEEIMNQASLMLDAMQKQCEYVQQSTNAKKGLWPWQK